jgi:dTDP-glucose 4,6-dehydratase
MLNDSSTILVTGGAGFIGSNFVLKRLEQVGSPIIILKNLTYAGNLQNLASAECNTQWIDKNYAARGEATL